MVEIHEGHDGGKGCEMCSRCQLIERLTGYVYTAAADGAEEWQSDVGPLIEHMHTALAALQRVWAVKQAGDDGDASDNAGEAAAALVALAEICAEVDERAQS